MIPKECIAKIKEVLSHQPFLCDKVLMYEIQNETPDPYDEESREFLGVYRRRILDTVDARSGYWYGNIVGAEGGRVWGGRYYAGCLIGSVLVITAKPFEHAEGECRLPPPIDTYFLDAVRHRVSQALGVPCGWEADLSISQVTTEGEQVLSELRSLEKCEQLWRSEYGEDQWLAVKNGTVRGHNKDRGKLEQFVRENNLEPPVLYVPPKGQEVTADILCLNAVQSRTGQ